MTHAKNLGRPEETVELEGVREDAVEIGPDEVLVSGATRGLASGSGLGFEDRGEHVLKGIEGPRRLYRYVG